MPKVSELRSRNISNAIRNEETWGGIIINVKDYGAKGDGVTDDTDAIQTALQAANTAGGGTVFLPLGTYNISTMLILYSNIRLTGNQATLKAISAISAIVKGQDTSNVQIDNLTFNGNSLSLNDIWFTTSAAAHNNITIKDCTVKGTATDATLFFGAILFDAVAGSVTSFRANNIRILNNTIDTCGTTGVLIAYADEVYVIGNTLKNTTNHGHECVGCSRVLIAHNIAKDCSKSGVGVGSSCYDFTIAYNTVYNCGGDGAITVEHNSVKGLVAFNNITDANKSGINLSFGTAGSAPFDKVQEIEIVHNTMIAKSGVTTFAGINAYSSTDVGIGENVVIDENVIDGFNIGITASYFTRSSFSQNHIKNLTGTDAKGITATFCTDSKIEGNITDSSVSHDAIQLLTYATNICDRITIRGNQMQAGAGQAFAYIEGTGTFFVDDNVCIDGGNLIRCADAANLYSRNNYALVSGNLYSGGTLVESFGNSDYSNDFYYLGGKKHSYGTAAPTTGTHAIGDTVHNTAPTYARNISHWVCINATGSGSWVAYGVGTGDTASRPTLTNNDVGYMYRDTTTGTLLYWNGAWI